MKSKFLKLLAKNRSFIVCVALAFVIGLSTAFFVACKPDNPPEPDPPTPPTETTYVVSFETNGGTAVESVTVKENATLDLSDYTTTKPNNYFYGWCLDQDLTTRASAVISVTADTKLYAEWGTEELYWLSFETGDGSKIEAVAYSPKAYLAEPEEPTRQNYSFGGWYKDAECTKEFSFFGAQMPKKNLTVYAKWNTLHGIIFETNGGSAVQSVFGETGDPITAPAAPTKTDFVFEGWFADPDLTVPYEISAIPGNVITVYAKWHEQITDIEVTLHLNHSAVESTTVTVSGNEGEALSADEELANFVGLINNAFQAQYLGEASDLTDKPIYKFSAWAFDENGSKRFDGTLPHVQSLDLYAVWTRSAAYCKVSFIDGEEETSYFVSKNTAIAESVLNTFTASAKEQYEALGCMVDGFYTVGGNRYVKGDLVAMDMRLMPYVYSSNLVYQYMNIVNDNGAAVKGYALTGYAQSVAEEYKAKDSLLLLVPEYYNDNTHGQLPVIWISDNAFADFPVNEVTLPNGILGIGTQAFANTKLTAIDLPSALYSLGDNVFSGSSALATVTFNSNLSRIGATIFKGTAYETTMPRASSFIFFDTERTLIYGYEGTATTVSTPSTAVTIGGGAFKDNTTIKTLTLHDNVRYVSDYAFENSVIETVKIGKTFANMGTGIFKNCTKLTTVTFVSAYNLSYIGESMFEGCTALNTINVSNLQNLQTVEKKAFYGCTSLTGVAFANSLSTVGESAFENCTSLVSADFGTSDYSKLSKLSNRAFAGCTSLRRLILRGELMNNQTISFGTNVLSGSGYTKGSSFVTPIIYVKDKWVDNWSVDDDFKTASYVDIYKSKFKNTEYANIEIRAIDSKVPVLAINGVVELSASTTANISAFDLLAFFKTQGIYTVSDDVSNAADCLVYIKAVAMVYGNATVSVSGSDGKYNLSTVGTYLVTLVAEDEFGNTVEDQVVVTVKS